MIDDDDDDDDDDEWDDNDDEEDEEEADEERKKKRSLESLSRPICSSTSLGVPGMHLQPWHRQRPAQLVYASSSLGSSQRS